MRDMKVATGKAQKESIQCVEVLIPKEFAGRNDKLCHTLSLYSLQNEPVQTDPLIHYSQLYHFMLFDWKRTVKAMLEERRVPYTIVSYFSPNTIYSDDPAVNYHEISSQGETDRVSTAQADLVPGR